MHLDHLILPVGDREKSVEFYTRILGLTYEGENDPFSMIRVSPDLVLQPAPFGTKGGEHLAFSMMLNNYPDAGLVRRDSIDAIAILLASFTGKSQ